MAMEDFRVDVVIGKGPGRPRSRSRSRRSRSSGPPPGPGCCPGPLRDRFGFTAHLEFYDPTSSTRSCAGAPGCSASTSPPRARPEIASRSRGTPRIANRLLRRVRDYAQVRPTAG